jgi:hypothetical protein
MTASDQVSIDAIPDEFRSSADWSFSDLRALYVNCTLKPSPEVSNTEGLMRLSTAIMEKNGVRDHGEERRGSGVRARGRLRPCSRCLARHARTRGSVRRVARALRAGESCRHPRHRLTHLARREVLGLQPRDRAPLRMLEPAQRARAVRLLRKGRRLPDHRQRGRDQALLDEHPLFAPAPRLHDPAAGRRWLDR